MFTMLPSDAPSDAARELVRGAYDLHVHVAPDVMRRRITDLDLAHRFLSLGLAGFALKSHYVPTAERAAVVTAAAPGIDVVGTITLNAAVGGLNPLAVEIAARSGAKIVWLPTVDAANHRSAHGAMPPGAKPPMWLALQEELTAKGMEQPEVAVMDGEGRLLPAVHDVLRLVAEHDLVLATGHLGRTEILTVTRAAFQLGVRRVVITHPDFPYQRLTADEQHALAGMGALLERTFTTPYTGKCDWSEMVANIRRTGLARSLITTDLGQPDNPPVEDGLALMADALLRAGFDPAEVRRAIVTNSRDVVLG